jgi:hypothetical protein
MRPRRDGGEPVLDQVDAQIARELLEWDSLRVPECERLAHRERLEDEVVLGRKHRNAHSLGRKIAQGDGRLEGRYSSSCDNDVHLSPLSLDQREPAVRVSGRLTIGSKSNLDSRQGEATAGDVAG